MIVPPTTQDQNEVFKKPWPVNPRECHRRLHRPPGIHSVSDVGRNHDHDDDPRLPIPELNPLDPLGLNFADRGEP